VLPYSLIFSDDGLCMTTTILMDVTDGCIHILLRKRRKKRKRKRKRMKKKG